MAKEGGSLEYSSTSYVPSSTDEEIPHILVKRDAGPFVMITASSPVTESPSVASTPVPSHAHSSVREHAPVDDDTDDPLSVNSYMTLAAFLTNLKSITFQPEPPQQESSQQVSF